MTNRQRAFLTSSKRTLTAMRLWHRRYLEATETARPDLHALLEQVPFGPAAAFMKRCNRCGFALPLPA